MIIGITGSSGAGKSTVCEILEEKYSVKVVNSDEIARNLSKKGTKYLEDIVKKFGSDILLPDGELDRKKLANIIYNNKEKREMLNNCTLKYIKEEIVNEINSSTKNIIAIDAPLLFEAEIDKICDINIAVVSKDKNMQIERIVKRDNIDIKHAQSRINAQNPNEFYINKCDVVIYNDDKMQNLEEQIEKIMKNINTKR